MFQRADERWVGRLTVGYADTGKPCRRTVYGTTKAEAMAKLAELRRESEIGVVDVKGWTVADWCDHWLSNIVEPSVTPRSHQNYKLHVDLHVVPAAIGKVRLGALTTPQCRSWGRWLEDTGRGPSTRQQSHRVLKQALRAAVVDRLIAVNPMENVKRPRHKPKAIRFLDADAARRVIEVSTSHRIGGIVALALHTGMRQGKLIALQWDAVDLEERRLAVRQSLVHCRGVCELKSPKTESSRRTIVLPRGAVQVLQERRALAMREGLAGCPFVFPTKLGTFMRATAVQSQVWNPIRDAAGVECRFHDLRHTAATLALKGGAPIVAVSEMLGHRSAKITLDVYSHVVDSMREHAADALELALA